MNDKPAGDTPEQIAAFVDAMVEQSVESAGPILDPVDIPTYGDVSETALLGVASGIVAAAAGTPVALHGRPSNGDGYTNQDVLAGLEIATDRPPGESASMIDETWFGYYSPAAFNADVDALAALRDEMGIATPLDVLERFANPAESAVLLVSLPEGWTADRIAAVCRETGTRQYDRIVCYSGIEGYDLVDPGSSIVIWDDPENGSEPSEQELTAGFNSDQLAVTEVPATSASLTEAVVAGERDDHFAEAVLVNAAVRMVAAGNVDSIEAGIERARDAIETGQASETLEDLRRFRSTGTKSVDW